jgi:hypothetical protein
MTMTSVPKVRRATVEVDFSKTRDWLELHRSEYVGKWVVLDGGELIGAGVDPRPIVEEARARGVKVPFVEFIRDDSQPFVGGWL